MSPSIDQTRAGLTGLLVATEIGVGSLVHAIHLPLGGHLLSMNQAVVLTFAARSAPARGQAIGTVTQVSATAGLLKALSPAGKRLTPMLAITVQGFLYAIGLGLLGQNFLGIALGTALLALWGFLQPLLLGYLIFGTPLFEGLFKLWHDFSISIGVSEQKSFELGIALLGLGVMTKVLVATGLTLLAWWGGARFEARYVKKLARVPRIHAPERTEGPPSPLLSWGSPLVLSLKDLLQPWFVFSLVLSVSFVVLSQNADTIATGFYVARILAVGWLVFFIFRAFPASWARALLKRFPALEAARPRH